MALTKPKLLTYTFLGGKVMLHAGRDGREPYIIVYAAPTGIRTPGGKEVRGERLATIPLNALARRTVVAEIRAL